MSSPTVYLITGANKGIGFALTTILAARPNSVVYATARDIPNATALNDLATTHKNLRVVKMVSGSKEDGENVVKQIENEVGKLDIVIANAGVATGLGPVAEVSPTEFLIHFEVNAVGVLVLFQAVHKLLLKSSAPQFDLVSTALASITSFLPLNGAAYGTSKAAANWILKAIHVEHPSIIAQAFHPGVVATDMSKDVASTIPGLTEALLTPTQSATALLKHIDGATREEKSGKFWNVSESRGNFWDVDTEEMAW